MIKDLFIKVLLLSFSLILTLALGEVAVRILIPANGVTHNPIEFINPNKAGFKSNSSWEVSEPEFIEKVSINSLGYRDQEIDPQKESIIFLGDSQTFGTGVNFGERTSDRVEQYVKKNCPNYNVLNVSMPGASTFDERRFLLDILNKGVKIKAVFLNIVTNDHYSNFKAKDLPLEFDPKQEVVNRKTKFSFWKKYRYKSRLINLSLQALSKYPWFLKIYSYLKLDLGLGEFQALKNIYLNEEVSIEQIKATEKAIEKIKEISPVSLILIPDRYRYNLGLQKSAEKELTENITSEEKLDFDREARQLKEVSLKQNIEFIDPIEVFKDHPNPLSLAYPINGHLTKEGHSLLAETIIKQSALLKNICR